MAAARAVLDRSAIDARPVRGQARAVRQMKKGRSDPMSAAALRRPLRRQRFSVPGLG